MKIYFTIDDDSILLGDEPLRTLCGWHCWKQVETDPSFGVAMPHSSNQADDTADRLIALGCNLLPALQDATTTMSSKTVATLSTQDVVVDDTQTTRDVATAMHDLSGFPPFRPTYH